MLTRMSDRTLSRRRSDGTIPYVKHGGSTVRSVTPEELADRADRLLSVAGLPNTTSTNKVKKS